MTEIDTWSAALHAELELISLVDAAPEPSIHNIVLSSLIVCDIEAAWETLMELERLESGHDYVIKLIGNLISGRLAEDGS